MGNAALIIIIWIKNYDPCGEYHVDSYLNLAKVQAALHVKPTNWSGCSDVGWTDSPKTVLPEIQQLSRDIRVWIYSQNKQSLCNGCVKTSQLLLTFISLAYNFKKFAPQKQKLSYRHYQTIKFVIWPMGKG
ncbi:Peptidase S10, serine carboxypeptidase [Corchorus capsularis]|uniref:Peptidase S10, serine carboxypeptidase n=1 Tax=Corchorus capsularis TaxID=210143 RepID=A0A1R3I8X7_COCAP|nr:Peptidase S10, serine carboxypeptidase [Corchorus capsularis]